MDAKFIVLSRLECSEADMFLSGNAVVRYIQKP